MATDEREPSPARARLEEVVTLCRKRLERADEKCRAARSEKKAAVQSLHDAQTRLALWERENPDPQRSIFEELSNV